MLEGVEAEEDELCYVLARRPHAEQTTRFFRRFGPHSTTSLSAGRWVPQDGETMFSNYFVSSPPRPSLARRARTAASFAETTEIAIPSTKSIDGYGDLGPIQQSKP